MKEQDCLRRFLFEELGIRGEWVCLEKSWRESKQHQHLPESVQEQLGQALAAVVLLSATIKFDGSLILQAQGSQALKTLVAQSTNDQKIKTLARYEADITNGNLAEMMGEGRLVITVEPKQGEPYQGIVSLQGNDLADAITSYFLQSEQLKTCVWLFADQTHVAGLLLQEIPGKENNAEDWERIIALANTMTKHEMLTLDCQEMLYRLFNEEKVRLFDSCPVKFECSCSRKKIEKTLNLLGHEEMNAILQERETIDVDCDFCGKQYRFDKIDVENIFLGQSMDDVSKTQH